MTQRWWMHFPLCPWGWRQGVAPAIALNIANTWRGNPAFVIVVLPWPLPLRSPLPSPLLLLTLSPLPLPLPIAMAVGHRHCGRHQPSPLPSLLRCRQPLPLPLPLPLLLATAILSPLAIAVAISIGHHRHRHHWPFPRVVALAWQELYSTNWSKECLPYFILFGRWASHWSKPDDWPGVERQWPTPALGGEQGASRQVASEGSGWQQGGSRGAAGWRHWLTMGGVVLLCCRGISRWQMAFAMMCWMW